MGKRRRGYFKHFNDSSGGDTLRLLAVKREYMAIALFWHLLEKCNQQNSSKIEIETEVLRSHYNCRTATLVSCCEALCGASASVQFYKTDTKLHFQLVNYSEYQDLKSTKNPRKSDETAPIKDKRLKIKDKRLNKKETDSLFEKEILVVYEAFPKKVGKSKGLKILRRDVQDQEALTSLQKAIKNYANYVSDSDPKFIKHFSTWASEWRDWVDFEPEEKPKQKTQKIDQDVLEVARRNEMLEMGYAVK